MTAPETQAREVLIGVTGGIAAYKTAMLVSKLVQSDVRVTVVMTDSAKQFVGPATFEALTGRKVVDQLFRQGEYPLGPHIALARKADLICVAPATANFLAKAANGIADDLLGTLLLCFSGPCLLAPAMNSEMWAKPVVQRNVEQLRSDGYTFVDPADGWLSCRQQGTGRMADPETIYQAIYSALTPREKCEDGAEQ